MDDITPFGAVEEMRRRLHERAVEIERLRAALQQIIDVEPEYAHDWGIKLQDIAREVLKG